MLATAWQSLLVLPWADTAMCESYQSVRPCQRLQDYQAVLRVAPSDPSAWNNLGNPNAALGNWAVAEQCFGAPSSSLTY